MGARPYLQFYTSDWRGSLSLRSVSLAARGLWMEMLCIMHEAEPYGELLQNGRPVTPTKLAALVGATENEVVALMAELIEGGVADQRRNGVIFSRRMVNDEIKRRKNQENGKKGGNPNLVKDRENPPSVNPRPNRKTKAQSPESRIHKSERETPMVPKGTAGIEPGYEEYAVSEPILLNGESEKRDEVRAAFDQWNAVAQLRGLPIARDLTDARRRAIRKRLETGGLQGWAEAIAAVQASRFLMGQRRGGDGRVFRADIDFVCQPKSYQRLREGFYGKDATTPTGETAQERDERLRRDNPTFQ